MDNFSDIKLNWLLYSEDNTNDYIAYPEIDGNSAVGSYFAQPGRYYISVYKTEGVSSNYSLTVNIIPENGSIIHEESEPNDIFENANSITLDSTVVGDLDNDDYIDNFIFEVSEEKTIKIDLELQPGAELNWVVFDANNTNEYYSYPDRIDNVLTREFVVKPGRYFLRVYKIQGTTAPYEINIVSDNSSIIHKENESNDIFENANSITLNSTVVGDLDNDDYIDNFVFEVSEEKTIKIDLELQPGTELNWVVFDANNTNEYYSYPNRIDDVLTREFLVIPGKYFLRVYKIQGTSAPYEVKITEFK